MTQFPSFRHFYGACIFDRRIAELSIIEPKLLTKRTIDLKARLTSHITDPQNYEKIIINLNRYLFTSFKVLVHLFYIILMNTVTKCLIFYNPNAFPQNFYVGIFVLFVKKPFRFVPSFCKITVNLLGI